MNISQIDLYSVPLPYSGGVYHLSKGRTYETFQSLIVRVTASDGTEGWGESTPFGSTYAAAHPAGTQAAIELLAPSLLGKDPRQPDRISDLMNEVLLSHNDAKAAIDIACWDLFGKVAGLPVCDLLGGNTGIPMPLISSIHTGEPEEMRARVADHRARGYRGHSIKIGTNDRDGGPSLDAQRIVACLADRQPGEWFLVDANTGLTPETARRLFSLLPDGLDFVLESPCATWPETVSVRKASPYPIILDELATDDADLILAIQLDAADGFGLKVTPAGGLTGARRQRDIARAAGFIMSVQDTVGSELSYAAIVHLGATVPEENLRCILKTSDMVTRSVAHFDPIITAAGVLPPQLPGLGVEVLEAELGSPVATWHI